MSPPAPQGPVPTCLKHDMAYASLQKFEGVNLIDPDTEREIGDTEELDITWNPRNKYLADDKFHADILKYGSQRSDLTIGGWLLRLATPWRPDPFAAFAYDSSMCNLSNEDLAIIMMWGVREQNDKDWTYPESTEEM